MIPATKRPRKKLSTLKPGRVSALTRRRTNGSLFREVRRPPRRAAFHDFRSSAYEPIEAGFEQQYGLPPGLLARIRTRGERSNADQVSPAGARTVYQFTPDTRAAFMQRYNIDPWASPQSAAQAAAIHLRESYDRTGDWNRAVVEYHGGPNPRRWGPRTRAYARRVGA